MVVLRSIRLSEGGFAHAFSQRGTVEADLLRALGVDVVAQAKQVHGAHAVEAFDLGATEEAFDLGATEADAIIGRSAGRGARAPIAVGVRVADCVPVLVGDRASGDVAAIHAGWRGIVAGVLRSGIERLSGSAPVVAIGPCIGPCCFEVGRDVASEIARACPGMDAVVRVAGDKAFVDLRVAVRAQLRALGVDDASIDDVPGCTRHEADRFHSFRRDGTASGRMLAAITASSYGKTADAAARPRST
jgi:purine-nucleoside/S-methyl-5'-thioadenosine phosphorylase / adenosine deaminase